MGFSQLNGLIDISLWSKYAAFMGYTHEELKTYFAPFITATASELKMTGEELLDEIKQHYDGFSFDGKLNMYNPFSVLSFFISKDFFNYWIKSGSNTLVRNMLKEKALTVDHFQGMNVKKIFVDFPGEIDDTPPEGFLYQAGYLTLRAKSGGGFALEYPNREVRQAISQLFLENLTPTGLSYASPARIFPVIWFLATSPP
jgi:hypothetical protein